MAEASHRKLTGMAFTVVTIVAVTMSIYHILFVSQVFEKLGIYIIDPTHRATTMFFLIILSLLILPMRRGERRDKIPWYDILIIVLGAAGPLYLMIFWRGNMNRYAHETYFAFEYVLALLTILVVLEITRRAVGPLMPLFALIFIVYMFTADHFPGLLFARSASITRAASMLVYSTQGLYGAIWSVAATVIIMFVIFGELLFMTPAGEFFISLAMALFGHVRGGAAKVAVVASSLFGTMSGSVTANIVTAGTFTIPMMKRVGYKPHVAAAVEAVSSTGGQIMPPVMGTSAFIMAEWLGIPYWSICVAGFIPAIFYYLGVFMMVDGEAERLGLHGLPRSECPSLRKTLKEGWTALIPLVALIYFMAVPQYSAQLSILYAMVVLAVIALIRKKERPGPAKWITALRGGGTGFVVSGVCCATAGAIVGAFTLTQLGIKLSDGIVALSRGNMLPLLLMAAALCYVLGMGVPTVTAYVMVVIFVAPALLKVGVIPLASHLFVFYWAITAFITPPVAVGAFVASGIAGSDPMKTGFQAMKLGMVAYAVSFMFVYNPGIILKGPLLEIIRGLVFATIAIIFLSWGLVGYGIGKIHRLVRVLFMVAGLALIVPSWIIQIAGLIIGGLGLAWHIRSRKVKEITERAN